MSWLDRLYPKNKKNEPVDPPLTLEELQAIRVDIEESTLLLNNVLAKIRTLELVEERVRHATKEAKAATQEALSAANTARAVSRQLRGGRKQ